MHTTQSILEPVKQAIADGILPVCEVSVNDDFVTIEYCRFTYDDNLAESNEAAMQARLDGLDGYGMVTLREYNIDIRDSDGEPTAAFAELLAIIGELQDYAVLDEDDYERREHDEADSGCMDWHGDDYFKLWRAGELGPDSRDVQQLGGNAPDEYPEPSAYPELDSLPQDGPVYDWVYALAYAKARDYI